MRRWLTLAALLLPWTLAAQTGIPITAIWDLDPSHDAPGLTWELERDGVIYPCGPVTVTASDRRCPATVPALAGVYRLRGVTASGEPGPWSDEGSGTQTAPGQFTITWHSPITLTPPEPTEMAVAYVSSASQTADLTSAGGNVDATLDAGTGSNRVVYAYVVWRFDRGTLTGVTYNGVSLTAVGSTANSGNFRGALYRLVGPTTGSNTLRASFTGSGNFPVWVTCISLDGVDSTTPEDTLVQEVESGSDTSTSQSVSTSSATDDRVLTGAWFATSGFDTTGSVVGSSYTIRQQVLHGGAGARLIIGDADGAATVTPETSYNNIGSWGALRWAINVNAASAGGADADGALNAPAPTLAASITVARTVSGALTVPPAVLAASSSVARSASGALVVPPSTLAAAVAVDRSASGAMTIGMPSLAATSTVGRSASGALGLPATTLSATITIAREVAGALVVAPLSLAATVESGRTASGALTLPPPTLSAAAARVVDVDGALTLPVPTLTAAVSVARFASGELALAVPVLAASVETEALTVSAALVLPMPVLDADAMVSRTASGALTLAMPVLDGDAIRAVQVDGVLLLRGLTTDATAAIARLASGDLDAPALMAQANAIIGALQPVLLTRADVVSLVPSRDVLSLMPVRTVEAL